MSKVYHNHDGMRVKCPFFHAEDQQRIYCEGVSADSIIHLVFISPKRKQAYRICFCERNYNACRVFKMNDSKYDDCGNCIN